MEEREIEELDAALKEPTAVEQFAGIG